MGRLISALFVVLIACSAASAQGCGPSNPNCIVPDTLPCTATGPQAVNAKTLQCAVAAGGGGVSSFNGRTGAVAPQAGDYPLSLFPTGANDSILGNFSGTNPATPIYGSVPSCSGAGNALTYNTSTHALGCTTISSVGATCNGTRLAKTANYTVANADKGSLIALGGSAFFTLTFGVASGYDSNFAVCVLNEDTVRAKQISIPSGVGTFRLYAQQAVIIFNDNNVWAGLGANQRWKLTTTVNLFVDGSLGSDSNDGLASGSGGAFLTPFAALLETLHNYDLGGIGGAVTITLACGTYNGSAGVDMVHYSGRNVGAQGGGPVIIQGCSGTAENTVMLANNADVFSINTQAVLQIQNMAVQTNNGTSGDCIAADAPGTKVYLNNVNFHWCNGNHMVASNGAIIEIDGNMQIRGDGGPSGHGGAGGAHVRTSNNGVITNAAAFTLTFNGGTNVDFTWFAFANGGQIWYNPTITLNAFTVTGQRWLAQNLGEIINGGCGATTFPGNSAGAPTAASFGAAGGWCN